MSWDLGVVKDLLLSLEPSSRQSLFVAFTLCATGFAGQRFFRKYRQYKLSGKTIQQFPIRGAGYHYPRESLKELTVLAQHKKSIRYVYIHGAAGSGKTQLAYDYANAYASSWLHRNKEYSFKQPVIFTLQAGHSNPFRLSYCNLAEKLGIYVAPSYLFDSDVDTWSLLISKVKEKLHTHPGWLLIVDGLDNNMVRKSILEFLPDNADGCGYGTIIITTRNESLGDPGECVSLNAGLSQNELLGLAQGIAGLSERACKQLHESTNFKFPLEWTVALRYISRQNKLSKSKAGLLPYTASDFLSELEKDVIAYERYYINQFEHFDRYALSQRAMFEKELELLLSEAPYIEDVLTIFCFAYDVGFHQGDVTGYLGECAPDKSLEQVEYMQQKISILLREHSLLLNGENEPVWTVHASWQHILRQLDGDNIVRERLQDKPRLKAWAMSDKSARIALLRSCLGIQVNHLLGSSELVIRQSVPQRSPVGSGDWRFCPVVGQLSDVDSRESPRGPPNLFRPSSI